MDFGTLMMSMGTPSGVVPGINNNMAIPTQLEGGPQFVDLLGLVEGMEVAEMSSASDKEFNFASTAEIMTDEQSERVSADKVVALAGLGDFKQPVGQEMAPSLGTLETDLKVAHESVTAGTLAMNAPLAETPKMEEKLDSKSVAAWSAAFAAGEISEVEVSNAAPEGSDLGSQRKAALVSRELEKVELSASPELRVVDGKKATASPQVETMSGLMAKRLGSEAKASDEQGFVPMAAMVEKVSADDPGIRVVETSEKKSSDNGKKQSSMQAKDFFLDRSEMLSGEPRAVNRGVIASSVAAGSTDMKTSDSNVADFVSDKVLSLQNAGGGTLRVGLDTADMGQIEIKVSIRGGKVDVRISGDNGELTRQLESSRTELTSKLEQHLELGDLKIGTTQMARSEDLGRVYTGATTAQFTEDLVRDVAREGIDGASFEVTKNERLESLHMSAPLAKSSESGMNLEQGTARDERREQALNRWATFSNLRKSA